MMFFIRTLGTLKSQINDCVLILPYLVVMPTDKNFAVKDVVEGMEYEFRVSAINISGSGEPSSPSEFVIARDPKSKLP